MDVPLSSPGLSPLLPGLFPSTNSMIRGSGTLSWLSPKAGLIDCSKPVQATVSFQLKDFCDSGVTDLTTVLRVGFRLSFHAIPNANPSEWIANYVSPVIEQDGMLSEGGPELNLEAFEPSNMPPGKGGKDTYSLEKEIRALFFLLQVFQKINVHYIPLSNLHSRISNSGDQELSRYIGSSSLKRRQFIEDRSYIFHLAENDVVYLQAPEVYQTVTHLSQFLLTHGGVTSSDVLFRFFQTSSFVPMAIKETIQGRRQQFMQFLARHPFAFAPFPSQYYVGVRRNLPFFEYNTFIRKAFPNFQTARPHSRPTLQTVDSFEQQQQHHTPLSSPMIDTIPPLTGANANPLASHAGPMGLPNGYGAMPNGHGHGPHGNGVQQQQQHHNGQQQHHHGSAGALSMLAGGAGALNAVASAAQSSTPFLGQQQQQNAHGMLGGGSIAGAVADGGPTAHQHQKPLFSLFAENLSLSSSTATTNNNNMHPSNNHHPQSTTNGIGGGIRTAATVPNGLVIRGSGGGGPSSVGGISVGVTSASGVGGGVAAPTVNSNSIWGPQYDIDLLKELTSSLTFGIGGKESASPPVITTKKREFVECAVQTDESSFAKQPLCANCAHKMH